MKKCGTRVLWWRSKYMVGDRDPAWREATIRCGASSEVNRNG
jgi:hypothetical protein